VDNAGAYDYFTANPTISYTTLKAVLGVGTHTMTFKVTDSNGGVGTGTATVEVVVPPPVAPNLVSPSGAGIPTNPVFIWNAVPGATDYTMYLYDGSTVTAIGPIFTAAAANCPTGTGQCSVTLPNALVSGHPYFWTVNASNAAGASPYDAAGLHLVVQ
jgi:hypothetical protein